MAHPLRTTTAFLCFLFCTLPLYSQVGSWSPQLIPIQQPMLYDIDMTQSGLGFAVGRSKIDPLTGDHYSGILMTVDFGVNWTQAENLYPRFEPLLPEYTVWRAVFILNENIAVVVGDSGMVYRTKDGGFTWRSDTVVFHPDWAARPTLRDVVLLNERQGFIVGGDILNTIPINAEIHPNLVYRSDDGKMWIDKSPSYQQTDTLSAALNACAYADGTLFIAGELGMLLMDDGTGYRKLNIAAKPAVYRHFYTDIDAISNTEVFVVGYDEVSNTPLAFRSIRDLSRFSSIVPGNIAHGVKRTPAVDFLDASYGWLGAAQYYTGMTNNACATWTGFSVPGTQVNSHMTAIDFIDRLNGWACGGDEAANSGWVIRFSGEPPKSDISVSDTHVDFGTLECEKIVEANVYIRSSGTGELVINPGGITFSDPGLQLVDPSILPMKIVPGKQGIIRVRWTLGSAIFGNSSATMSIVSNDIEHNPWTVAFTVQRDHGTLGFMHEMQLSYGACLYDSVFFPTSVAVVGNRTPTFISWNFVSGHNDFAILAPDPGTKVASATDVLFSFVPSDSGMRRGVYNVIHGNPACPDTTQILLTGFGEQTILRASVDSVDFGELCVGSEKDTSIVLENIGNTYISGGLIEHVNGDPLFGSPDWGIFIKQDSIKEYRLFFAPLRKGSFKALYRIISGPCSDTLYLKFSGRGIETELEISPKSPIRLGPVFVQRVTTQDVVVTNTGTTDARITDIRLLSNDNALQINQLPVLPLLLQPGQTSGFVLRFAPVATGEINTRLLIRWDARCADTVDAEVVAICVPNPEITAPDQADLGIQSCPPPLRDTIWIRNNGNGPLVFYNTQISGVHREHFTIIQPKSDDTVHAKSDYPIIIEYNRPDPGVSNAILMMMHNDQEAGRTEIRLNAERTVAFFEVEGDKTTPFFTRLFVDENRTFTIRNTSLQPMTVTDIDVIEEASVFRALATRELPIHLLPGDTLTFVVVFTPDARGPFNGVIQLSGMPCDYTTMLGLNGSGDTEGLSTDKGSLSFILDPCEFTVLCIDIVLKNQAPERVLVNSLVVLQSETVFTIDPSVSTPFSIGPDGDFTVRICASPAFFGERNAVLQIHSNDPAYPLLTVGLHSKRDSSALSISTNSIDFGRSADCQRIDPQRVTITNTGTLPETVTPVLLNGGTAFSISMNGPETIQPGRSYTFDIVYLRPSYGAHNDILELTTTRCKNVYHIALSGEQVEQSYFAAPDPVVFPTVNIGGVSTRQLTIQNYGGFDAVISGITISPTGPFTIQGAIPKSIDAGGTVNVALRFSPTSEGQANAELCVYISSPCPDTICVQLQGNAVRGTLEARPAFVAFQTLAQCQEEVLNDTLINSGSGPITILSASITGPDRAAFTNLTPVAGSGEILPVAGQRIFTLRYTAATVSTDGVLDAVLQIRTDDMVLPSFDLPLEAGRVTQVADAGGVIDFGVLDASRPEQRTVTLHNRGSVRLCYERAAMPSQVTFEPPLPLCIDPGNSADITVTFSSSIPGNFGGVLSLGVLSPCEDSTIFHLSAVVQEGALLQRDTVRLATAPWCETFSFNFTALNSYLERVTLTGMHFEGGDASYFSILSPSPSSLPRIITAGASEHYEVSLLPDQQNKVFSTTFVAEYTAFGQPIQRRTVLVAEAVVPSLHVEDAVFPVTVVGQSGGIQTVRVRNTSAVPVNVSQLSVTDTSFIVRSQTPSPPATLQPGGEMVISIEFNPKITGIIQDSLVVISQLPCFFRVGGLLRGEGLSQPIVDASLTVGDMSGEAGQLLDIPISIDKSLGGAQVEGWVAAMTFNRSMLYPIELITDGTASAGFTPSLAWDYADSTVTFGVSGSGIYMGASTGLIAWLRCRVLVGDAQSTTLTLKNFAFTGGYARVAGIVHGRFELINFCMPDERLLHDRAGFRISQSIPNPVSQTGHGRARVSFDLPEDAHIRLQIFDRLGRMISEQDYGLLHAGSHSTFIEVGKLRPGVYHYVLHSTKNTVVRSMVVIE